MPIRINLLAEAQAAEELRRKDPVKRAVLAGILIICAVMVWSSTVQVSIIVSKSELSGLQSTWQRLEKNYNVAVDTKRKALDAEEKLSALQRLTTNRFLWGTALNAFQQTLAGIDDVQVIHLKTEQSYSQTEVTKPGADGKPAKQVNSLEKIGMLIDAVDSSSPPGGQVNRFKEAILSVPFFQNNLQKTNGVLLTSLSAPNVGPLGRNAYVMFTLQCYFPEKVR